MASLLTNLVPVFTGTNWLAWYPQMELSLMAQGLYYVITDKCPSPNEQWILSPTSSASPKKPSLPPPSKSWQPWLGSSAAPTAASPRRLRSLVLSSASNLTPSSTSSSSPNNLPNREDESSVPGQTKGKPSVVTMPSIIVSCCLAHTPSVQDFGPPAFETTLKAFDLLCQIGITPSYEDVHTIETCLPTDPAPKAGPSATHPHLEERISTAWFTAKDDAISMASGYDYNDIYNMYIDHWACKGEPGDDIENNSWQVLAFSLLQQETNSLANACLDAYNYIAEKYLRTKRLHGCLTQEHQFTSQ
ncbi:hypothetical protein BS17DRAFT_834795 [Gyrodon lividus]|nr:hypothetical protein BS17DRAFT_834795 [Gyrodon lividus]